MILADAGTAYTKIRRDGELEIVRTESLDPAFRADMATGHNADRVSERTVNELVALARGGFRLITDPDFDLVDIGCRDVKLVRIRDRRYAGCGWNDSCGSLTGFTVELLARYFELDFKAIEPAEEPLSFTCGVFGISEMFDRIYGGGSVTSSVAGLVRGLADRVYEFSGQPGRLYLSGGLSENSLFVRSFPTEVVPLGRAVLLEGLARSAELEGEA